MDYNNFQNRNFRDETYAKFVLDEQCPSITRRLKSAGFSEVWASDFDGSAIKHETVYAANRKWSPVVSTTTGKQAWHELRKLVSKGRLSNQLGLQMELQAILDDGRTLSDCLSLLSNGIELVDGAAEFLRLLNKQGIALVIVSNGPHQIVSNMLRPLGIQKQYSPTGKSIKTPVVANLLSCSRKNCNQQLNCGNCIVRLLTPHGDVGVNKGDIIQRFSREMFVRFTTGDSLTGDGSMVLQTVLLGGSALIRQSENPEGDYNNKLLEWAQHTLPDNRFIGFDSYNEVIDFASDKLLVQLRTDGQIS